MLVVLMMKKSVAAIHRHFDLRPAALIQELDLLKPGYIETAAHGHFGRKSFSWEKTDRAAALRREVGL